MSKSKSTRKLTLQSKDVITQIYQENQHDEIFRKIEDSYGVKFNLNKVGILVVKGDKSATLELSQKFKDLTGIGDINLKTIEEYILNKKEIIVNETQKQQENWHQMLFNDSRGFPVNISPKTDNQRIFIDKIVANKVIFGNGASGTGKTMLAVCVALKMLEKNFIKKIWITRPNLPSESFGFLPGGIDDKMLPFFQPIYSIIDGLIGKEKREGYISKNKIEILPVAFARGITIGSLQSEILIVDESENLTLKQMFLMLSRIGSHKNSKIIFCGDSYQSDLGYKDDGSLIKVEKILKGASAVEFVMFTKADVVRSPEVQEIVERFEKYEFDLAQKKKN